MEWFLGTLLLLCGIGVAVALPLAFKEEAANRRAIGEAQIRAKTLDQELTRLKAQLEEATRRKTTLEQESVTRGKEIERLSGQLSRSIAQSQTIEARLVELERQLKTERDHHRTELAVAQEALKRAEHQTPPISTLESSPPSQGHPPESSKTNA